MVNDEVIRDERPMGPFLDKKVPPPDASAKAALQILARSDNRSSSDKKSGECFAAGLDKETRTRGEENPVLSRECACD